MAEIKLTKHQHEVLERAATYAAQFPDSKKAFASTKTLGTSSKTTAILVAAQLLEPKFGVYAITDAGRAYLNPPALGGGADVPPGIRDDYSVEARYKVQHGFEWDNNADWLYRYWADVPVWRRPQFIKRMQSMRLQQPTPPPPANAVFAVGDDDAPLMVTCALCGARVEDEYAFFFPIGDEPDMPEEYTEKHYCHPCGHPIAKQYGWYGEPVVAVETITLPLEAFDNLVSERDDAYYACLMEEYSGRVVTGYANDVTAEKNAALNERDSLQARVAELEADMRHIYHIAESALRAGGFIDPVQWTNMNQIFECVFKALGLTPDNPTPPPTAPTDAPASTPALNTTPPTKAGPQLTVEEATTPLALTSGRSAPASPFAAKAETPTTPLEALKAASPLVDAPTDLPKLDGKGVQFSAKVDAMQESHWQKTQGALGASKNLRIATKDLQKGDKIQDPNDKKWLTVVRVTGVKGRPNRRLLLLDDPTTTHPVLKRRETEEYEGRKWNTERAA